MQTHGALGIITEVSLRTYPLPKFKKTLMHYYPDIESYARTMYEADSYDCLYEELPIFACGMFEDILPILTGKKGAPLALEVFAAYDEETIGKQEETFDKIAKKYGGKELPAGNLLRSLGLGGLGADTWGLFGGGFESIMGRGVMVLDCSLIPTLLMPKIAKTLDESLKKIYETTDAILTHPQLNKPGYVISGGTHRHGISCILCYVSNEPTLEKRQALYDAWHKHLEVKWDAQTCAYWWGKDAHTPHLLKRMDPIYFEFLKRIKKTMDPNNIMNPGCMGLGVE